MNWPYRVSAAGYDENTYPKLPIEEKMNQPRYAISVTKESDPQSWLTADGAYTQELAEAHIIGDDRLGEFVALTVELGDSFPDVGFAVVEVSPDTV